VKMTKAMERALQQAREQDRNAAADRRQARQSHIEQATEYRALKAEISIARRAVQDAEAEHGRLCNRLSELSQRLGKEWDAAREAA
jgi:predicted  nucleic acid-binding Zn-ribbon protein